MTFGNKEDTTMISRISELKNFGLAAMTVLTATIFVACSNDDESIEQQPVNTTEQTYTLTVEASKGENTALARATRALSLDDKTLNATWNANEEVAVVRAANTTKNYGTLKSAASTNGNTTLTGSLENITYSSKPAVNDNLYLFFPARTVNYAAQAGTIADIAERLDYSSASVTVTAVDESAKTISASNAVFTNHQAVVKFTLQDNAGNDISASSLTIHDANNKMVISRNEPSNADPTAKWSTIRGGSSDITILPSTPTNVMYVAISSDNEAMNLTLTATVEGYEYTYTCSNVTFTDGKYYEITVKMRSPQAVNLALAATDIVLNDGDKATGILSGNYKVSIADGATVTLDGVTIDGSNNEACKWAGITCLGNATIILVGTNNVKGFYENYPGIYVPTDKTLTIRGTGSLTATSNRFGAGIGGGYEINCGNIMIESGTIKATIDGTAPAIGGGSYASCGNITICGTADVTATLTSLNIAAAIGSSMRGSCGDITISGSANVTATAAYSGAGIGSGHDYASCGNILISGGNVSATGGKMSAGIGSGSFYSKCGTITVTTGVSSLIVIKGPDDSSPTPYSIGSGYVSTCGAITIGGTSYGSAGISESPFTYPDFARPVYLATSKDIGKIVGVDGKIYNTKDAAVTAGTSAAAIIAYTIDAIAPYYYEVGWVGDKDYYFHGLAIALEDEKVNDSGALTFEAGKAACEGRASIAGATWIMPTRDKWTFMFQANGGLYYNFTGLNTTIQNAGGTPLVPGCYYWVGKNSENAVGLMDHNGEINLSILDKNIASYSGHNIYTRACLVF